MGNKTSNNLELLYKLAVIGHFIRLVGGEISYWNMRVLMPGSKLEHCGHDVLPCNTHKTHEWLQQKGINRNGPVASTSVSSRTAVEPGMYCRFPGRTMILWPQASSRTRQCQGKINVSRG